MIKSRKFVEKRHRKAIYIRIEEASVHLPMKKIQRYTRNLAYLKDDWSGLTTI